MLLNFLVYIVSFILIWIGAGLIVSSMDKFSRKLRLSPFIISFLVLGVLTSVPELAVGLTSIAENDPEVFVGNLLGGIPIIFLFVIPMLAIFGNGINIRHEMDQKTLLTTLGVILLPSFLILDHKVTTLEGALMMAVYIFLIILIQKRHGIFDRENTEVFNLKKYSLIDVLKIVLGIIIVFVTSQVIVDKTMYTAEFFNISPFVVSLIVLPLGTNMPEISLAIRSAISGKKDVAFGDYMGSAAANTLLFGLLTLLNNGEILTVNNFYITFAFITISLGLFYYFAQTGKNISRIEGAILFLVYIIFVVVELTR